MLIKKTYLLLFILMIVLLVLQTCSDSGNEPIIEQIPVIEQVMVSPKWNLADTSYNKVEAKVLDPQGAANIDSVIILISTSMGEIALTGQLYDDGAYYHKNDGDVFAGDGVFSNRFDAAGDIDTTIGAYQIEIRAFDLDGNQSDPTFVDIDLGYSYVTEFVDIQTPDTLLSGADAAYLYVALKHPQGLQAIDNVAFNLYNHSSTALLESQYMFNDGDFDTSGDVVADDSVFSFKVDYCFAAGRNGLYDLEFAVTDEFNTITQSEKSTIFLENNVGEILELNVPDQMTIPSVAGQYTRELITAQVTDPQGLADVDSVYFYSRKPDGNYANSGNPFIMVDNGKPFNPMNLFEETGDVSADDGIYSFSLLLYNDPNTLTGTYIFSFYMRDKVGNLTVVKMDSLEVN